MARSLTCARSSVNPNSDVAIALQDRAGRPSGGASVRGPVLSRRAVRSASKSSAAAAAETLSDSTWPRRGIATSPSQAGATRGRSPFPSPPRTSTAGR